MDPEILLLVTAAVSVGVLHTLLGPDHYLPFGAMARAGAWSRRKTLTVTGLCGVGHVAGSVVLGLIGIAFGLSLAGLESFEASRESLAAWGLILFGLLYMAWGLRRKGRGHRHSHLHAHGDGTLHAHEHDHTGALALVTGTFAFATVGTMLGAVLVGFEGVERLLFKALEPHAHTLAGLTILLCGVVIQFLGI